MLLKRIAGPGDSHFRLAEQLAPQDFSGGPVAHECDAFRGAVRLQNRGVPLGGLHAAAAAVSGQRCLDELAVIVTESSDRFAAACDDGCFGWNWFGVLLFE